MANVTLRRHQKLEKTVVNTYNLVYHWQGSDDSLKPLLLMGHQDVVPVNPDTLEDWINPPFSGLFDGKPWWLWNLKCAERMNR